MGEKGNLVPDATAAPDVIPLDALKGSPETMNAGIESKSNFGSAYTAVNGNMYSMISKYGVVGIRLPDPDRSAFLARYDATIYRADPAWPPSKEYVTARKKAGSGA